MSHLDIPPQPALPPEEQPNEAELSYIESQVPNLWPDNQDSTFGLHRKIICETLQEIFDTHDTIYDNIFVPSAEEFLYAWEEELGLPQNPSNLTLDQRRLAVAARKKRGAFTRTMRRTIVEQAIQATFGDPLGFTSAGLTLTAGGLSMPASGGSIADAYWISENVQDFSYGIYIDPAVTPNIPALTRELDRLTPAHIRYKIFNNNADFTSFAATLSGNEITDATRTTNTGGDGITPPDSSFGTSRASTNQIFNGGFESGTAHWAIRGAGTTITRRDAAGLAAQGLGFTTPKFGGWACHVFANGADFGTTTTTGTAVTNGTKVTYSAWVDMGTAGGTLRMSMFDSTGTTTRQTTTFVVGASQGWKRYIWTITPTITETVQWNLGRTASGNFVVDGVQAEILSHATQTIPTDGAAATRNATRIRVPATQLEETRGWMEIYWIPHANSADLPGNFIPFTFEDASNNRIMVFYNTSSVGWESRYVVNGVASGQSYQGGTFVKDVGMHILFAWDKDANEVKFAINGGAWSTSTFTGPVANWATTLVEIGGAASIANHELPGRIKRFAYGSGHVTDAHKTTLVGWGESDRQLVQYPTGMAAQLRHAFAGDANGQMATIP